MRTLIYTILLVNYQLEAFFIGIIWLLNEKNRYTHKLRANYQAFKIDLYVYRS